MRINVFQIGSGPSSSLQNSMTSQTASNVSALVSLQQTALHENLGSGLSELSGNGLSHSGLGGGSLGNSLSSSLTGNPLHSGGLGELAGNGLDSVTSSQQAGSVSAPIPSTGAQSAMMQQQRKPQKSKLPPPSKVLNALSST